MSLLFELNRGDLISPAHEQAQRDGQDGHVDTGGTWAPAVAALVREFGATSVLDYGAGQGSLSVALVPLVPACTRITKYDPCVERINVMPSFADIVVVVHVLEHVEVSKRDTVLAHIKMLTRKAVFAVIDTDDYSSVWFERLAQAGFVIKTCQARALELAMVLTP